MKCVIVISLCLVTGIKSALLNKEEGEKCNFNDEKWSCQTPNNCPQIGDIRRIRPDICGFKDKVPIICCPPDKNGPAGTSHTDVYPKNTIDKKPIGDVLIDGALNKPSDSLEGGTLNQQIDSSGSGTSNESPASSSSGTLNKHPASSSSTMPTSPPIALMKCIEFEVKLCRDPIPQKKVETFRNARDVSSGKVNSRLNILGNQVASPYQFPFMASIGFGQEGNITWECAGTLISDTWVLSAAHCAESSSGKAKWIGTGAVEIYPEFIGIRIPIKQIVIHPSYKAPAMYHDIGLYQHEFNFAFNQYLRPVCLYPLKVLPRIYTAAGWGTNALGRILNSNLIYIDMNNSEPEECQKLFNSTLLPRGFDNEIMFCANERERNTCAGDSGGSIFYNTSICLFVQHGVIPSGRNCKERPGVFTRISYYLPWIESIVWPDYVTPEEFFSLTK